jgi:hypothetical protein
MAFTTPGTAQPSAVLTSAFWNTNVRDNTNDLRSYQNRIQVITRTAGTYTPSSSTWGAVDATNFSFTVPASTGDWLELTISGKWGGQNTYAFMTGFNVTDSTFWQGAPTGSSGEGAGAWAAVSNTDYFFGGSIFYEVVAGAISAGNVTVRPYVRVANNGTSRNLFAVPEAPLHGVLRNLGPATT